MAHGTPFPADWSGPVASVAVDGVRSGVADLTWGQLDIWRMLERRSSGRHSIHLTRTVAVPPGRSAGDVVAAVGRLVERHETLRTTFHRRADGTAQQRLHAGGALAMAVRDVGPDGPADLIEQLECEQLEGAFDHAAQWPLWVTLLGRAGAPRLVHLCAAHLSVDGWGMSVLGRDLARLLAAGPGRHPAADTGRQPLDQAAYEASPTGERIGRAAARYWRRQLYAAGRLVLADPPPDRAAAVVPAGELCSTAVGLAADTLAWRLRASPGAVVLAAVATLLALRTGATSIAVQAVVNNRFERQVREAAGTFVQTALLVVEPSAASFAETVRRADSALLGAYRHGRYPPDTIARVVDEVGAARGGHPDLECYFHHANGPVATSPATAGVPAATVTAATARGAMASSAFRWVLHGTWQSRIFCFLRTEKPATVLRLRVDGLGRADLEALVRGVEVLLVHAIDHDPDRSQTCAVTEVAALG